MKAIERILTEIIGRPSRWSGRVELTDDPEVLGRKPFRCDIVINQALVGRDKRWRTLIHELLHSYSIGYNSPDYQTYPGWEEGIVEALQRRLRPGVLTTIGVSVDETIFEKEEARHRYNDYITALETLRIALHSHATTFYLDLLALPIRARSGALLKPGLAMLPLQRTAFVTTFSRYDALLREKRL